MGVYEQVLTYKGDTTHMLGQTIECPRLTILGGVRLYRWKVVATTYVADWDKTYVQVDRVVD